MWVHPSHGRVVAGVSLALLWVASPDALAQTPNGPPFQVNTYTTGFQAASAVAVDGSGHVVVGFSGQGSGDVAGMFARRFTSAGLPRGVEFKVNTYTTFNQGVPSAAADRAGNFVIVWEGYGADGHGNGIFGQRFNAAGLPIGGEFQVNTHTTGSQEYAAVAMDPTGNFVVAWREPNGPGGASLDVVGRRYDVGAGSFGTEFRVNSFTTGYQTHPSVAIAPDGAFVVAWYGSGPGDNAGVFARRFDSLGAPLAEEFRVNAVTTSYQVLPSVSFAPDGGFIVAWQDRLIEGNDFGIAGQRYDAGGSATGSAFVINTYVTGAQRQPRLAVDSSGSFMVVWHYQSANSIRARQFDASGNAIAPEFTVATGRAPMVAAGPAGQFVVTWHDTGYPNGSDFGVFGRRYGDLIFADTFDSGSVSAWSAAAIDGGDLSVDAEAALAGTAFGLKAQVDDTAGLYVQDDAPADENRYRARFFFDPNGFDPGTTQSHLRTRILIGFEDAPNRRLFALVLRLLNGQYSLMGRARRDDNSQANTGFFPISDGPHYVELDWRRSSGPDALDGSFQMWIDGAPVSTLMSLDNSVSAVDFVRLGALSVKAGAVGTLLYDEFVSRRAEPIGGLTDSLAP